VTYESPLRYELAADDTVSMLFYVGYTLAA